MKIELAFKKDTVTAIIPDSNNPVVLTPHIVDMQLPDPETEVTRSIHNPIGSAPLCDIVKPGENVVIITSDITRPVPSYQVIPPILRELLTIGVKKEDITVIFALGSHRKHTEEEMRRLVGDYVYETVSCIDTDPNDCIHVGTSKAGTPYNVFSKVVNADRRICVGNIEYHYFAGYSGGAKAIMPGVCTRASIQSNHSMMVQDGASTGRIDGNPVRKDIDEVADFVPIDFIVNVVLDEHKKLLKSFAGHYIKAHRAGCEFLDGLYRAKIEKKYDIVVVSAGGHPKDINLYQAQKALDNASFAVADDGVIILVASCGEGLGESAFERWMTSYTPKEMVVKIKENFELGGHKAAAISMVLEKADIFLVSSLTNDFVSSLSLTPFSDVNEAIAAAVAKKGESASICVIPYGGATLPWLA